MHTTPVSLLQGLRQPSAQEAWSRFVRLYTPLLFHWANRVGMRDADAADLVQDVFLVLIDKLPSFQYDATGSFRGWLRTVTLNKWRERTRRAVLPVTTEEGALDEAAEPDPLDAFWDGEYQRELIGQALRLMQAEFQPTTWKACWEHVVSGKSAIEVAAELNLTPGAVRAAKFRVISRLRQELDGLLD